MSRRGQLHVGTSGWHYPHWVGPFYPEKTPTRAFLPFLARHLHSAEINNSFYRLPTRETFEAWRRAVPPDFLFAVKASRFITHMKKLREPPAPLALLYERVEGLGEQLGPILFQLPPRWRYDGDRLRTFLEALSRDHRHAVEFRDPSWFNDEAAALLARHDVAFCIYELAGLTSPLHVTAPFVYLRLHGPGEAYQGSYDTVTLATWAGRLTDWADAGRDVYCYFDNDEAGHAAHDAIELTALLGQATAP